MALEKHRYINPTTIYIVKGCPVVLAACFATKSVSFKPMMEINAVSLMSDSM